MERARGRRARRRGRHAGRLDGKGGERARFAAKVRQVWKRARGAAADSKAVSIADTDRAGRGRHGGDGRAAAGGERWRGVREGGLQLQAQPTVEGDGFVVQRRH